MDDVSLISAVDLLPTFCEVAGFELPESYRPDGVSQSAALLGQPYPSRQTPLFWKYPSPWPAPNSRPDHWLSYAVVDEHWKLAANRDLSYCELYDIAADPYERMDLKEQQPAVVKQLLDKITDWRRTLPTQPDPTCFSSERSQ